MGKTSKIRYGKHTFCIRITVRLAFTPVTGGDGSLLAGCVRSYVNLRDLGDTALRIPDIVSNIKNWRCRSYVNLQSLRHPTLRIFDSVGVSKNRRSRSYVNLRVFVIRWPISARVWAVPKDDQASRSRGAQPSFRKCRILLCPFSPERAVPGPERPKWPNPR